MHLQIMVDHWGQFKDVFVGMPSLMNDAHNLGISNLYGKVVNGELLWLNRSMEREIKPYILGDKWYPLLPCFIILHKQIGNVRHIALEVLFNKQLYWGRSVIKNAFGILKKTFNELFLNTNLLVLFLLDVVVCCCIIYNMLFDGKDFDIDTLLIQLKLENFDNITHGHH